MWFHRATQPELYCITKLPRRPQGKGLCPLGRWVGLADLCSLVGHRSAETEPVTNWLPELFLLYSCSPTASTSETEVFSRFPDLSLIHGGTGKTRMS